ncbi:MAG: histidinol-phosphatase [Candidatus Omnitrophica bacterium CG11_big_fil_rev_8_21_14_0_20_45_26]|uniref:DNA-directed DNA polymerase n=1 Tax=Candidatus Abzuiibacterium crystallinum TaxID=1974748 RepID=A0A2H0LPN7_9BACT|nr:MAG: histidinol-phosphatase [Candidatus Omnitrophica bacterium CG11_big_fil_rev_8_21_14_0_20_45_26]PIW63646.1 MAG: histidinol-phosphatase [Candidatus Omnitrophica bacterium CG12_big_fil_rev_8_21_14_0_65_45_16]
MDRNKVIEILEEMAVLLELKSANPFRVRAFQNAARSIESVNENLEVLAESDTLTKIPGVGKGISELIKELYKKGYSKDHDELRKSFPEGFLEILHIPGVGPKRAKTLYEKLDVKNIAELQYACKENRLLALEGFGEKSQQKILQGIEHYQKTKGFFLVSQASHEALELVAFLKKHKEVKAIAIAGSLRRHKEIVHDIDILAAAAKHAAVHKQFASFPNVERIVAQGETKSSVILKSGLPVDLRTVSSVEYPYALQHFTGSKEHNVALRTLAKQRGLKMNEYGLFKGSKLVPCRSEAAIYEKLGMAYIEPELRENMGEIEAAKKEKMPILLKIKDIKGIFHAHSTYSDGSASLETMVQTAQDLGHAYIGISDHSQSAHYANGLSAKRIESQHQEIDRLQKKFKKIKIFKGIESDILEDGSLDYPDKILKTFDFIIASVHSRFGMNRGQMTKRLIRAAQNPYTTMIGHISGRLLLGRAGYDLDYEEIFDECEKNRCVIELNANPHRLDLDWRLLKSLGERKLLTSINPDAHDPEGLGDICFGVGIARKGWLDKKHVLNTRSASEIESFFRGVRSRT